MTASPGLMPRLRNPAASSCREYIPLKSYRESHGSSALKRGTSALGTAPSTRHYGTGHFYYLPDVVQFPTVHPDLERLIRLQALDTQAADARKAQTSIPETQLALDQKLEGARSAVAAAREKQAANQADRRALEKDLAALNTRLSRYKDQLMEVKTNREYTAMQHEIETAQGEVKRLEDQMLEKMLEADELAAGLKAAEAALKTAEQKIVKERAELDVQLVEAGTTLDSTSEGASRAGGRVASVGGRHLRVDCARSQGHRRRRRQRRAVQPVPGAPETPGLRAGPHEQRHRPVRQLPAHPLLRAAPGGPGPASRSRDGMITAYIDGGSRGNPGPAGYGVQIVGDDGAVVAELYGSLPHATNNVAEYNGLLAALAWAVDQGQRSLHIRSDSELLVKQLRGEYRVKNPGLQPLYQDARALIGRIGRVTFEHVRRELNKEADRLANLAMDEAAASAKVFGEYVGRNFSSAESIIPPCLYALSPCPSSPSPCASCRRAPCHRLPIPRLVSSRSSTAATSQDGTVCRRSIRQSLRR